MDHPLIHEINSKLRQRVIQLLRSAYSVMRDGNIIFVCGGNNSSDMRPQFREYCEQHHPQLQIFFPESAMKNYFASGNIKQFNLADFETLVGELSHAVVLFPEAAGSYAETGYFSLQPSLAEKTILTLNSRWQGNDSFISMGPAMKINATSRFNDVIQMPYENPNFAQIVERIERFPIAKHRKTLVINKFRDLSNYEVFCLIHQCFSLLRIATIDDIIFIFRALFKSQFSEPKVKQLASILGRVIN